MNLGVKIFYNSVQMFGLAFQRLNLHLVTIYSLCHLLILLLEFFLSFGLLIALITQHVVLGLQLLYFYL